MPEYFIGLMSGTSMDAIDAVLVDMAGDVPAHIADFTLPLPAEVRRSLRSIDGHDNSLNAIGTLDVMLGKLFADAVNGLLQQSGIVASNIVAIGSHGQTIHHHPHGEHPFTLQIADPSVIAERTGITTVADFRRRDIAAGGQGAPLVPAFHARVFRSAEVHRGIINIGGIANLTVLPADQQQPVIGFDTGPGNGMLDAWANRHLDKPMDKDGAWAAGGTVDNELLELLLTDGYFGSSPPKSTGFEYFNIDWLDAVLKTFVRPVEPQDVQTTLTALTARTIADAMQHWAPRTSQLFLCGGGTYNLYLGECLQAELGDKCELLTTSTLGVGPQWVEATGFAWLAQQTLAGKPGNLPDVTGANRPVVLGGIYQA